MAVQISRMLCIALTEGGTIAVLFAIGRKDAEWNLELSQRAKGLLIALCAAQAADLSRRAEWEITVTGLSAILAGCLLTASVMDLWECMVYRFVWWAGGAAAGGLFVTEIWKIRDRWSALFSLIAFFVLQQGVFGKMYGRADCDAFCICAAAFAAFGRGFEDYVIHMAVTFGALALVQGLRRNIAANGNLKKPVPLVPYITVAFWFWVDFMV